MSRIATSCLITSRVAAPCAVCREYAERVHMQADGRFYCGDHCPLCGDAEPLAAGEVVTVRGKQEDLFV